MPSARTRPRGFPALAALWCLALASAAVADDAALVEAVKRGDDVAVLLERFIVRRMSAGAVK